ncbi:type II toxin-antitoxin system death-on-curing family toxin [Halolamina sp. C58]|uniref:type II toxin-antitoxin system death-on-curing family toxin n=1 Tax=Halolamina sp. C58 TaxID=3421640 RepID=UPI003EB916CB
METLLYPDPAAVLAVHEDIVEGQPDSEPGVRTPAAVASALSTVSVGHFGHAPETVHEAATELLRLLVAEHPFVDGNKRTALNTAVVVYEMNGYALPYGDERIRSILKRFGVDAAGVETAAVTAYLRSTARPLAAPGDDERLALVDRITTTSDDTRVAAVRRLAALDRERNAATYDRLATE